MKTGIKTAICVALLLLAALSSAQPPRPRARTNGRVPPRPLHSGSGLKKGLNPWTTTDYLDNINSYDALKVDSIRIDLVWNTIEPGRGQFTWTALDTFVNTAMQHKTEVLFTLRSISSWATKIPINPNDPYHGASGPKNMSDWTDFVGQLASRYASQNVDYEVENEVNSTFWGGTLADYLDLLKTSYSVIKSKAPHARVLCSAMACGVSFDLNTTAKQQNYFNTLKSWLNPILATQAFDVVSVHDYYFCTPSRYPTVYVVNGQTAATYLDMTSKLMQSNGVANRPVWITEVGYVSQPVTVGSRTDPGSPRQQAQWLRLAHVNAATFLEEKVERFYWLIVQDHPAIGYFSSMGLEDTSGTHRPAWNVFQAMR